MVFIKLSQVILFPYVLGKFQKKYILPTMTVQWQLVNYHAVMFTLFSFDSTRTEMKWFCGWTQWARITTDRRRTPTSPCPSVLDRRTVSAITMKRWEKRCRGSSWNSVDWASTTMVSTLFRLKKRGAANVWRIWRYLRHRKSILCSHFFYLGMVSIGVFCTHYTTLTRISYTFI